MSHGRISATQNASRGATSPTARLPTADRFHYDASTRPGVTGRAFQQLPHRSHRAGPGQKQTGMTPPLTKRDPTILLALVGGGSAGDDRYHAALASMQRCRVAAVYSPVPTEAETLGTLTGGQVHLSLRQLFQQPHIGAILVLESGWVREWAISLAAAQRIPVFVAAPVDESLWRMGAALTTLEADGAVIVPGSVLRTTPAALRLRELVATKLGPIQELAIEIPAVTAMPCGEAEPVTMNGTEALMISVIDWCRSLLSSTVSEIDCESTPEGQVFVMSCGRRSPVSPTVRTTLRVLPEPGQLIARVRCQRGEAVLSGESHISWQSGEESDDESLTGDRPPEQVLLDLFLRRVVGGVVPVPSWADLQAACELWGRGRA